MFVRIKGGAISGSKGSQGRSSIRSLGPTEIAQTLDSSGDYSSIKKLRDTLKCLTLTTPVTQEEAPKSRPPSKGKGKKYIEF